MNFRSYRTIIQKDDKGFRGFVPSLPGCHSFGKTIEETQKNLKEAIEGWLLSRQEKGWEIPEDTLIESLQTIKLPTPSGHSASYA